MNNRTDLALGEKGLILAETSVIKLVIIDAVGGLIEAFEQYRKVKTRSGGRGKLDGMEINDP